MTRTRVSACAGASNQLAEELGLDRERMRGWGIVHALAWGVSERKLEPEQANWLLEA